MKIEDEQRTRPQVFRGCDWSVPLKVLAVKGKLELWWRKGFTGWIHQGASGYYPGVLYLVDLRGGKSDHPDTTEVTEGGRLGRPMFTANAAAIDKFFGGDVAAHLHPNKTVVLK